MKADYKVVKVVIGTDGNTYIFHEGGFFSPLGGDESKELAVVVQIAESGMYTALQNDILEKAGLLNVVENGTVVYTAEAADAPTYH